jgi:hypothetical protein
MARVNLADVSQKVFFAFGVEEFEQKLWRNLAKKANWGFYCQLDVSSLASVNEVSLAERSPESKAEI